MSSLWGERRGGVVGEIYLCPESLLAQQATVRMQAHSLPAAA